MPQSTRLLKNQKLRFTNGKTLIITKKLGEGGQGIVYLGIDSTSNEQYAVKWENPDKCKDIKKLYRHIEDMISVGTPSPVFTWPLFISEWTNGSFGYAIKLIPEKYKSFSKYVMAKVQFPNLDCLINAAINIVEAFKLLHNAGYSYQDLNEENLFINPDDGEIIICDTENVMGQGHYSGVLGKSRYMAPEIVRGETLPNKETDKYSIALILFMLLMGDHPLEGARTNVPCLTNKYDRKFFGTEPLFMFDKFNNSNMPRKGLHDNAIMLWPYYTEDIRDAFERSFSQESLMNGIGRLPEQEWLHKLVRLKSSIVKCPTCGNEMFIDCNDKSFCIDCGQHIKLPGIIKFKSRFNMDIKVPIYKGVRLFGYHLFEGTSGHIEALAEVLEKPGKFGLLNKSNKDWIISSKDGNKSAIRKKGEIAVLGTGLKIDFGNGNIAEIKNN